MLASDHVGDCFAGEVQEVLDIQVIGSLQIQMVRGESFLVSTLTGGPYGYCAHQDQIKQRGLLDTDELLVPSANFLLCLRRLILDLLGSVNVELAVFDDLAEDAARHIWQGNSRLRTSVCNITNNLQLAKPVEPIVETIL